jgi:hypothetical protein
MNAGRNRNGTRTSGRVQGGEAPEAKPKAIPTAPTMSLFRVFVIKYRDSTYDDQQLGERRKSAMVDGFHGSRERPEFGGIWRLTPQRRIGGAS